MTPKLDPSAEAIVQIDTSLLDVLLELEGAELDSEDHAIVLELLRWAFVVGWEECYNVVLDGLPSARRYVT